MPAAEPAAVDPAAEPAAVEPPGMVGVRAPAPTGTQFVSNVSVTKDCCN